jgi:hypothetical protein
MEKREEENSRKGRSAERLKKTAEEEIVSRMEDAILRDADEEEEDRKRGK